MGRRLSLMAVGLVLAFAVGGCRQSFNFASATVNDDPFLVHQEAEPPCGHAAVAEMDEGEADVVHQETARLPLPVEEAAEPPE